MPYYVSDLLSLKMRLIESLDEKKSIPFAELRRRIQAGELRELIDAAGKFPEAAIPDVDWQELTEDIKNKLWTNIDDEAEHYYVENNGFCLLLAILIDMDKSAKDFSRPLPN